MEKIGLYKLENKITGRAYIGQSSNIYSRIISHYSKLIVGNHFSADMQYDFNKYGLESFSHHILHEFDSYNIEELLEYEKLEIEKHNNPYNIIHNNKKSQTIETLNIESITIDLMSKALMETGGNRRIASDLLGITQRTLYRYIKKYPYIIHN